MDQTISIAQPECVFLALGIRHGMNMFHIVICGLLHSITFFHVVKNGKLLKKIDIVNKKCVF
jgi:hypothetical protein